MRNALLSSLAIMAALSQTTAVSADSAEMPSLKPILKHIAAPRQALDLSGEWQASPSPADAKTPATDWKPVAVPGEHSRLFSKANGAVWFKRSFQMEKLAPGARYMLCFERVTDSCEVFVNGVNAGASDDGLGPFRIDATAALKEGANELLVKVLGPGAANASGHRPVGWIWFYGGYAGIPCPVHLERTGELQIQDVHVITKLEPSPLLEAEILVKNCGASNLKAKLSAKSGDAFSWISGELDFAPGQERLVKLSKAWPNPKLWWPHDPQLQFLDISMLQGSAALDACRQRFGFREIKTVGPDMLLNGVKLLHRRSSVIPYWKNSGDAQLRESIAILRERGFNGWRLHGGSVSPRISDVADEEGWLLAPESAINTPRGHEVAEDFWPAAAKHIESMVKTMRNSPAVIYWDISNEFASYYMKGSVEEKAVVDARMLELGRIAERLDPTRIWTCDGDGELGGVGKHGPAPTLNFHYPWQPFKTSNMIPNSVGWLDESLAPWQGIAWDRSKPLMIGEDLHPPYAFKMPDGPSQWAGDSACDPEMGAFKAWFDAVRMLADGYYQSGVSVWNIWATAETAKGNPLYKLGQPAPDFLIACRELPGNFRAGTQVEKTLRVYNKTFKSVEATLKSQLKIDGAASKAIECKLSIPAGAQADAKASFAMPELKAPAKIEWHSELIDASGKTIASQSWTFAAVPELKIEAPAGCAFAGAEDALKAVKFPGGRFASVKEAIESHPSSIAAAALSLDAKSAGDLRKFVSAGGKALLIESIASSALPLRLDPKAKAAFAFIRASSDPALKGLDESMLKLWSPARLICQDAFIKPGEGDAEILLDSGYGLRYSPLARVRCGAGYYLLCQLPVASAFDSEPAAKLALQTLLNSLSAPLPARSAKAALATEQKSKLADAFKKAGIALSADVEKAPLLAIDGREPLDDATLALIEKRAEKGFDSLVDGIGKENAAKLSKLLGAELKIEKSDALQMLRNGDSPLSKGIANTELCWFEGEQFGDFISAKMGGRKFQLKAEPMLDGELSCSIAGTQEPFKPAGLLKIPFKKASLLVSSVRWTEFQSKSPLKSRSYIAAVLRNSGCRLDNGPSQIMLQTPVDISKIANSGFWSKPDAKVPAWFGDPKDDLRYFPVNVTGNDPVLNMPQPPERFPEGILNFAGSDFKIINPELNEGRACAVIQPKGSLNMALEGQASALCMLGALAAIRPEGAKAATVEIKYQDGSSDKRELKAGVELNGYQYATQASHGACAWTGPTPTRSDAVLWCWSVAIPHPERKLAKAIITVDGDVALGIVACSLERRQ